MSKSKIKSLSNNNTPKKNLNLLQFPTQSQSEDDLKKTYLNINSRFENKKFHQIHQFKQPNILSSNSTLKIQSWNVNSLHACLFKRNDGNDFKTFIDNELPDILLFNETKLNDARAKECSECLHTKYKYPFVHFLNSTTKKGQSGVGIASRYQPSHVYEGIMSNEHDGEGRVITCDFDYFYLVSCQTPNAGDGMSRLNYRTNSWEPYFRSYLGVLKKVKPVILGGDLNFANKSIDIQNTSLTDCPGFSPEERREANYLLKDQNFVDSFRLFNGNERKQSFFSQRSNARAVNNGWRLDQFVCSNDCFSEEDLDKVDIDKLYTESMESFFDAENDDIKNIRNKVNDNDEIVDQMINKGTSIKKQLKKNKSQSFNNRFKIVESNIYDQIGSDHTPIGIKIKIF